ncbi:MAG: quinone-dependent dihydroorotate dehydrogenase, partial [Alphaproteobacteria bacterium]|nr:quinone-dependent dihydroorotate dehydrogenase [Alphaproteobacteria bacterium]
MGGEGLVAPARVPDLYPLIRPLLRALPAEAAHRLTVNALAAGLGSVAAPRPEPDPPSLGQTLWGRHFPNPVGVAAGFDKDAEVPDALLRLGCGFAETGTVTPRPQKGNAKPRLFRLYQDDAVINRLGFNSRGLETTLARLRARPRVGIVGVNLGKNRDSADAAADYVDGVRRAGALADYFVINVSSPNTSGLRDLQRRDILADLLRRLVEARDEAAAGTPLLVKIAPDLDQAERADIAGVVVEQNRGPSGIDGIVVANTTVARPAGLRSRSAGEAGGLSGKPLFAPSTVLLGEIYRLTGGAVPLVGVGGIASAEDAYAKIRAGASLVQLYTALVFQGPGLIGLIRRGLAELLRRDGFATIGAAVGADHRCPAPERAAQPTAGRLKAAPP